MNREHHDGSLVAPAAPRLGDEVAIALWADAGVESVLLRAAPDGEEELWPLEPSVALGPLRRWTISLRLHWPELRYRFLLRGGGPSRWLTGRGATHHTPLDGTDFLVRADDAGPPWLHGRIFYEVFVDRFARGPVDHGPPAGGARGRLGNVVRRGWNELPLPWAEGRNLDFFGGDLDGIRARLDHLEALGVSGLYLTPIFSALTNHRYDVVDHGAVDPTLGGDAALERLAAELRRRGFRYLLDAVLNHVGSGHRWFNREGLFPEPGAFQNRALPAAGYFRFDEWPHRYRAWKGIDLLPKLDYRSEGLRAALWRGGDAPLRRWLRAPFLADGYRFDAANMLGRDGEVQLHGELWPELCASLRQERPDAYLLGEHYFDPTPLVGPRRLDGAMSYLGFTFPVRRWLGGGAEGFDAGEACAQIGEVLAALGWQTAQRMMLHVDTHDLPRLRSTAGEAPFRAATVLQLALPGVPCVYYGDEWALPGGDDPDNRRPMPWPDGAPEASADAALREDAFRFLSAGVAARRGSEALREGGLWLWPEGSDRIVVVRAGVDGWAVAIADRAAHGRAAIDLSGVPGAAGTRLRDVHSGSAAPVDTQGRLVLDAAGAGGRLFVGHR